MIPLLILFIGVFLFLWWISTRKKTAIHEKQTLVVDNVTFTVTKKQFQRIHISSKRRYAYEIEVITPKQLPALFIDAHHSENIGYATEYRTPKHGQAMNLEGDFNNYFQAYAPRELHSEVLTLLTPDVMAILIDKLHITDAQTTGSTLILKSNSRELIQLDSEIEELLTKISRFSKLTKTDEEIAYSKQRIEWHDNDEAIKVGSRLFPAGWFFLFLISALPMTLILVFVYFFTDDGFKYANWWLISLIYVVWFVLVYKWSVNRHKGK